MNIGDTSPDRTIIRAQLSSVKLWTRFLHFEHLVFEFSRRDKTSVPARINVNADSSGPIAGLEGHGEIR